MFKRGNQNQERELKDIDENIWIEESLLKRYKSRLLNFTADEKEANDEILRLKSKIAEEFAEFQAAPAKIEHIEKKIVNLRLRRDKLTGKITGTTKLVSKLHKMQEDMAELEKEIASMNAEREEKLKSKQG